MIRSNSDKILTWRLVFPAITPFCLITHNMTERFESPIESCDKMWYNTNKFIHWGGEDITV